MLDVKKRFGDHSQSAGDDLFYLEVKTFIMETVIPSILLNSAIVMLRHLIEYHFVPCFLTYSALSLFVNHEHFEKHFNINQEKTIPID